MALSTMIENITKAREEYERTKAALGENAQKEICAALAEFIPEGQVLHWTQYTPYFNDGSPCEFSVHDCFLDEAATKDDEENLEPYEGTYIERGTDLRKLWDSLPDDMMLSAFGDHVRVLVRRDGTFTVGEHDHD